MSIISLQEIMLVASAAIVIIAYHTHLYKKVRRDPLKTAIGITNHARQMWVKGVIKDRRDITAVQTLRNQLMAATFLEGETILVLAGLAAHQGYLVLTWVILAAFLGSLCGDQLFFIWDASIVRWFYPGGRAGSRKRKKFTK